VYVWGSNNFGQLGVGDTHNILNRPTVANQIKDDNIVQIACGSFHTMALSNQGLVFATGLNNYGQLMLGRSNV
jgi:alpha-tubulin suppressor-like RCC1 family protein